MTARTTEPAGAGPRVLVIDDDPEIRAMLSSRLGSRGFQVIEAADGEDGLLRAVTEKPDVVVLDVMMPGMTGWEVARELRRAEVTARLPILMLTAIGAQINEMTSPLIGAAAFMDKPFDMVELERVLRELAASRG